MNGRKRLIIVLAAVATSVAGLSLAQIAPPGPVAPASPGPPPSALNPPPPSPAAVGPITQVVPPDEGAIPASAAKPPSPTAPVAVAPAPPKPPAETLKRPRYTAAVLQGVDKITAETLRFEVKIGEPVRYKGLIVTVHACEGAAADEGFTDAMAHMEVQSRPEGVNAAHTIYRGWMFASSPSLHPMEHPIYDLWLIACKTAGAEA